MVIYAHFRLWIVLVYVVLKSLKTELVSILKVAIILSMLLNGIIRQMYKSVVNVGQIDAKLRRRCS